MLGDAVVATGDGFLIEDAREGRTLVATGSWSADAAAALRRGAADGLILNYARGFQERDLRFLDGLPVRRLELLARTLKDISPIYGLAGTLQSVSLDVGEGTGLDLGRLPSLHTVAARWNVIAPTLDAAPSLRRLTVSEYAEPDLRAFAANRGLTALRLKDARALRTLAGVDALPALSELAVLLARRLEDVDDLRGIPSDAELYEVEFDECPQLSRLDALGHLTRLRLIGFSDCKDVESVAPLRSLANLEVVWAWGSTRVLDNDLSPIASLPRLRELRMMDRRDYRPRVKEIAAKLPA